MTPTITYKLAMAAGRDAANRNIKAHGRDTWNEEDYGIACELVEKLLGKGEIS